MPSDHWQKIQVKNSEFSSSSIFTTCNYYQLPLGLRCRYTHCEPFPITDSSVASTVPLRHPCDENGREVKRRNVMAKRIHLAVSLVIAMMTFSACENTDTNT